MAREYISLKVKLAAALLQMKRPDPSGVMVAVISHDEARGMTADQVISRFHFDHYPIFKAHGGPDEPWNLDPRPVAEHRAKTAKSDVPQIAKTRRIVRRHDAHEAVMAAKHGEGTNLDVRPARRKPKSKIPARVNPWPAKGSRKIQNRRRK